jgi:hypothetical protein
MNDRKFFTTMDPIDIHPNKASWILGNGRVVDVSKEGWNNDETAFSHGIFVKQWVKFRVQNFCPDKSEADLARVIDRRAKQLMVENPNLLIDDEENSDCEGSNPFEGDLAYVQAAEEQGWIRVKPMPRPVLDNSVFMETYSQDLNPVVAKVLKAAKANGLKLTVLTGGAIANRGFWVQGLTE